MSLHHPASASAVALALAAALLLGCAHPPPTRDAASRRTPAAGPVVGFTSAYGAHAWLGIPYAAPPVGALRWRAPRPAPVWESERAALAHGPACAQLGSALGGPEGVAADEPGGSEDCLYLDVYAPRMAPHELPRGARRLPVMVWIHGGSNVSGSNAFYDGGRLAEEQGVVVVVVNYRLGPMGWLRHAALREGASAAEASGNFGTLDTIRALEWVRDDIAAFGGDPGRVTVFGESAGGQNVYALLLSPLARGLFQRAIVESGGLWMATPENAENAVDDTPPGDASSSNEVLMRLVQRDGLADDRAAARALLAGWSPARTARYMRSLSAARWLQAYEVDGQSRLSDMPKVFRDGVVLPSEAPMESFAAGRFAHVPLIVGTNRDENKLFLFFDDAQVGRWLGVVPRIRNDRLYQVGADYLSRRWKAIGADEPASAIAAAQQAPVFVYRFDWDEEPTVWGIDLGRALGAAHAVEIPFVFGHFDLGRAGAVLFDAANAPGREELSAAMRRYWADFARAGDPNVGAGGLPHWPRWQGSSPPRFLVLDTSTGGGIRSLAGALSERGVLARIDDDPRLRDDRERCTLRRALVGWGRYRRASYDAEGACRAYPFDAYPWPQ